ncbi:MAG: oligoendopeptidase F [Bacillota bacterium]|nr:oligoendopeptidase F [Bacillota bacterium]
MQIKMRHEVAEELTWDLTHLYPDQAAFQAALGEADRLVGLIEKTYAGRVSLSADPQFLLDAVRQYEQLQILLDRTGNYASLAVSVDMANDQLNSQYMTFESRAADMTSRLSFLLSELMEVADELLVRSAALDSDYAVFFEDIRRKKQHKLTAETEKALAALGPALGLPFIVYEQAKHADMDFGTFTVDGKTLPLSFVLFENEYNLSADRAVRQASFTAFSDVLRRYQNTSAALYNGEVQKQKTLSRLRGYESVIDYLLEDQKIDRALYDRQIDVIMSELAPHMRRYARLLQRAHHLEEMTFADLKISLESDYDPQMTIAEARTLVSDALSVLGAEYRQGVMRAFDERWIDFAQNAGKMTGGFCASPYQVHGYILLSWTSHLSEVFTLAHELGHAMHFVLANQEQPWLACEPSLYMVEAPSTCNELFLMNALLQQNQDQRFQRWVLSSVIQNTYFHNFVTHLLEAAWQREVYRRVDKGEHLQASDLSEMKRSVLTEFWGDAVTINEGAELTWMRQPHYYMGLYSYTYSAGLTIATEVSRQIGEQGEPVVQNWLKALRSGASVTPVEFAALAGVDVTSEEPLRRTIAAIGDIIDRIEALCTRLD